jgi:hypothetical protein
MRSMLWLRLVLIGLGGALGAALLVHGNLLIGGLLCAMAVLRLTMVISLHRRRRALRFHRVDRQRMMVEARANRRR